MERNNLQNKDAPPKKSVKHRRLLSEIITLQEGGQCVSLKLSKLLRSETKSITELLNCGISYLAAQSEIAQDIEYYKAINSLILARDKFKTLIDVEISMSLKRGEE